MTAIAQALSSALLHFVWQGAVVAFLLWVALFGLRKRSAQARYLASCGALAVLAAMPVITAALSYSRPATLSFEASSASVPAAMEAARAIVNSAPGAAAWAAQFRAWALPVWSFGVLLFSIRLAWGCFQVSQLRRRGAPAEASLATKAAAIAARIGLARPVRLLVTVAAESPAVVGWIRPVILLPSATLLGLTAEQLEAVLAHELAHIRRYDYLVNLFQTLVETLLFYHPAVWWTSARIRHERELCCDDLAVGSCGDAVCYARALTRLERLRSLSPSLAVGSNGGSMLYRVQRLVGVRGHEYGPSKLSGVVALTLGIACFAVNLHWARGQEQQPRTAYAYLRLTPNDSAGVTVDLGGATVLHRTSIEYPGSAIEKGIQGSVVVEATLDDAGDVADAHILAGPPELRKVALQSVLQWHFAPGGGTVRQVTLGFQLDAARSQERRRIEEKRELEGSWHKQAARKQDMQASDALSAELREEVARFNQVREAQSGYPSPKEQLDEAQRRLLLKRVEQSIRELRGKVSEGLSQELALPVLEAQLAELQGQREKLVAALSKTANAGDRGIVASELEALTLSIRAAEENLLRARGENQVAVTVSGITTNVAGLTLNRIEISGLSEAARQDLGSRLPVKIGDTLTGENLEQIARIVRSYDQHLEMNYSRTENGRGASLRIAAPGSSMPVEFHERKK